jgi:hypothetical protein
MIEADAESVVVIAPLAVDTDTAAKMLGVSASTIRAFMRRGDLIPRYVGTKPIFPMQELQCFLEQLPSDLKGQRD